MVASMPRDDPVTIMVLSWVTIGLSRCGLRVAWWLESGGSNPSAPEAMRTRPFCVGELRPAPARVAFASPLAAFRAEVTPLTLDSARSLSRSARMERIERQMGVLAAIRAWEARRSPLRIRRHVPNGRAGQYARSIAWGRVVADPKNEFVSDESPRIRRQGYA